MNADTCDTHIYSRLVLSYINSISN